MGFRKDLWNFSHTLLWIKCYSNKTHEKINFYNQVYKLMLRNTYKSFNSHAYSCFTSWKHTRHIEQKGQDGPISLTRDRQHMDQGGCELSKK